MGSGFTTFTAGNVLTASEMNNYLMEQSVMVFATTGARDSAITAPEAGMTAYINSGDSSEGLYSYTGTTWNKGPSWNAPWGILTSAYTQTTSAINATHTAETVVAISTAVTLVANRTIKITAGCQYASGSASLTASMRIRRGTTTVGATSLGSTTVVGLFQIVPVSGTNVQAGSQVVAIDTGASGSTLYSLTTTYGTGARDDNPTSFIVEDIGPSGAPN